MKFGNALEENQIIDERGKVRTILIKVLGKC